MHIEELTSGVWRGAKVAAALLLALSLGAWGAPGTTEARHDAARFILEKLRAEHGETWDTIGREFLWHYDFDVAACWLTVQRQSAYGDQFTQAIPLASVVPEIRADATLALYCDKTTDCVAQQVKSPSAPNSKQTAGEAKLLVPEPDDVPKLSAAFGELHRLCDDAYQSSGPTVARQ